MFERKTNLIHLCALKFGLMGLFALLAFSGCFRSPTESGGTAAGESAYRVIAPFRVRSQQPFPIVVIAENQDPRLDLWETFSLGCDIGDVYPSEFSVKRGWGSASVIVSGIGDGTIRVFNEMGVSIAERDIRIETECTYRDLSGILSGGDLIWDSTAVIHLTADATVPAGSQLFIYPGTRVEMDENVRLLAEGSVFSLGEPEAPVLFTSNDPDAPWGEIHHSTASYYRYTFFTNGGGDEDRPFGHSGSQPVLGGENGSVQLTDVYLLDNPGKAFGFTNSSVSITSSLITRCDTGGEFKYCTVSIEESAFLDIPNGDNTEVDDDNDALYLDHQLEGGFDSSIRNCIFITGKDDGIDHAGASVVIADCVIEDFDNEGIAASTGNSVSVFNTLILGCGQGIEAGYGEPAVSVNHCTLVGNGVGIRFGDSYTWGCYGSLNVVNSIVVDNNEYNVWNYDLALGGPREDAITVTYSIVNQPEYDDGEGCLIGAPSFTVTHLLTEESIGTNAASDGLNMGILP